MLLCGVRTQQTCRTHGIVQFRGCETRADGVTRRSEKQGDTIAAAAVPSQARSSENMVSLAQEDSFLPLLPPMQALTVGSTSNASQFTNDLIIHSKNYVLLAVSVHLSMTDYHRLTIINTSLFSSRF